MSKWINLFLFSPIFEIFSPHLVPIFEKPGPDLVLIKDLFVLGTLLYHVNSMMKKGRVYC